MPYVVQNPIDWTTVLTDLYTWVRDTSGITVVWRDQKAIRPASPYITLKRITSYSKSHDYYTVQNKQKEIRHIVVTDNVQSSYTATVNLSPFVYTPGGSETIEQIRDGLQALIVAGSEPVTVTPLNTDTIVLTANAVGTPFDVSVTAGLTTAVIQEILRVEYKTHGVFGLSMQAHVDQSSPDDIVDLDASYFLDRVLGSLELPAWDEYLAAKKLVIQDVSGPTDIPFLDGTQYQSRAVATLTVRTIAAMTEDVGIIETALIDDNITGDA